MHVPAKLWGARGMGGGVGVGGVGFLGGAGGCIVCLF